MGNIPPSPTAGSHSGGAGNSSSKRRSGSKHHHHHHGSGSSEPPDGNDVAARASKVMGDVQAGLANSMKKLEEHDNPVTGLLDTVCGAYLGAGGASVVPSGGGENGRRSRGKGGGKSGGGGARSYSDDYASDDYYSEEETTVTDYRKRADEATVDESYVSTQSTEYDDSTVPEERRQRRRRRRRHRADESSYETEEEEEDDDTYTQPSRVTTGTSDAGGATTDDDDDDRDATLTSSVVDPGLLLQQPLAAAAGPVGGAGGGGALLRQPLASSFAKRCYFTKAGIGGHTQHYEGLTLTGNVVLMLAQAMKLKGCPTICDEDLRRVEQTYPNQFSRLPDELLLSSGWRRISKHCHFSGRPVPDGIPFFHSRHRLHPAGGYYFLLAAAVGMVRPVDVEPLTRDTLVLLETDYPTQCDAAPAVLIQDPGEWTLVDKFCFFSGGPINTDEDVYYQADFDGNPIFMLAFLSPSLTPAELYKLGGGSGEEEPLQSTAAVEEVESVYDLTERDFDDLKLYHLGPCRALPQYILQPQAWTKVLPPHFLAAREAALQRAHDYEVQHGIVSPGHQSAAAAASEPGSYYGQQPREQHPSFDQSYDQQPTPQSPYGHPVSPDQYHHPHHHHHHPMDPPHSPYASHHSGVSQNHHHHRHPGSPSDYYDPTISGSEFHQRSMMEEEEQQRGASYMDDNDGMPMDEAIAAHAATRVGPPAPLASPVRMDPPEDQPPSLSKARNGGGYGSQSVASSSAVSSAMHDDVYSSNSQNHSNHHSNNNNNNHHHYEEGSMYMSSPPRRGDPVPTVDEYNQHHPHPHHDPASYYGSSPRDQHPSRGETFSEQGDDDYPSEEYSAGPDFHPGEGSPGENNEYRSSRPDPTQHFAQPSDEYPSLDDQYEPSDEYHSHEQYEPSDEFHSREDYASPDEYDRRGNPDSSDEYYEKDQFGRGGAHHRSAAPKQEPYYPDGYGVTDANASPGGGTEFSIPTVSQSGMISRGQFTTTSLEISPDNSIREMDSPPSASSPPPRTAAMSSSGWHLPPTSPHSVSSDQYSPSSATRGAQELLRRNRQRRLERSMQTRQQQQQKQRISPGEGSASVSSADDSPNNDNRHRDPEEDLVTQQQQQPQVHSAPVGSMSSNNWESGSDTGAPSEFSGAGSSVWTDGEAAPDARSSRRALILQMAKARMKSTTTKQQQPHPHALSSDDDDHQPHLFQDEKKDSLDVMSSDGIDFAGDLD